LEVLPTRKKLYGIFLKVARFTPKGSPIESSKILRQSGLTRAFWPFDLDNHRCFLGEFKSSFKQLLGIL
jgi:hypothetical protein